VVTDLSVLRELAEGLLRYDAVTFLQLLDTLRLSEGRAAVWLLHSAAHTIFDYVRQRTAVQCIGHLAVLMLLPGMYLHSVRTSVGVINGQAICAVSLLQAKRRVFLVQRGKVSSTGKAGGKRALAAAEDGTGTVVKARELLCMCRSQARL
jgi:hypothetical protein